MRIPFKVIFVIFLLSSCTPNIEVSGIDFNDYYYNVASSAGFSSMNCGVIQKSENQFTINTCVVESFMNKISFYAIYRFTGYDSFGANGISYDSINNMLHLSLFFSSPGGSGLTNNGAIYNDLCINAAFSGTVDTDYKNLFLCDADLIYW